MQRPCLLCGKPTYGSVGAAGLKWAFICQPCKDAEDAVMNEAVSAYKEQIERVIDKIIGGK